MDVREKLLELLTDNLPRIGNLPKCDNPLQYTTDEIVERIADHLIANGVTVQEWISVEDRLPEDSGYYLVVYRDKYNGSISIALDNYVKCGAGEWWASEFTHNITHWMPLPEPPKGE